MTQNMKEAVETIGGLFHSSPINEHNHDTTTAMSSIRFLDGRTNLLGETRGMDDTFGEEERNGAETDDMTMNMKAAMEDLGDLFCSPGEKAKAPATDAENSEKVDEEQPTKFLIFKEGDGNAEGTSVPAPDKEDSAVPFHVYEDASILSNPNATATGTINFRLFDESNRGAGKPSAVADEKHAVLPNAEGSSYTQSTFSNDRRRGRRGGR